MTNPDFKENSMPADEIVRARAKAERKKELDSLRVISFTEFEAGVKKWILLADKGILKLLPAVLVANKFQKRDPVWMMIIGPSGGGKTELLNMLLDLPECYMISLLTPNTLLSGMTYRGEVSLLPEMTGKIMVFKDWTNIMSINKDSRNELYGQLREVYDGKMTKRFGNGKVAEWQGKVGLIAGVTPAYDVIQQANTTLGERFINYRLVMPDREEVALRSIQNGPHLSEMRTALRNLMYAFMKGLKMPENNEEPPLSEKFKNEIIPVANFATMARSGVIREFSYKREIIYVPAPEMPTRSVQVLSSLAAAMNVINGGEDRPEDLNLIYRMALDSIPDTNYMAIKEMARGPERTTKDIATALGYPTTPIRMYLENLALLGVCERIKAADSDQGGTGDRWTLQEKFNAIVHKYEHIKKLEDEEKAEQEKIIDEAVEAREFGDMEEGNLFEE